MVEFEDNEMKNRNILLLAKGNCEKIRFAPSLFVNNYTVLIINRPITIT